MPTGTISVLSPTFRDRGAEAVFLIVAGKGVDVRRVSF